MNYIFSNKKSFFEINELQHKSDGESMEMTQAFIEIEALMKKEKERRVFERSLAIVLI